MSAASVKLFYADLLFLSIPYINGSIGGTEVKTEVMSLENGSLVSTELTCDSQYQAEQEIKKWFA